MWCIIPYLIGIVSFFIFIYFSWDYRSEIGHYLIPGWLSSVEWIFAWLILFLNVIISAVMSLIVTLIFGGFFIENFIAEALHEHSLEVYSASGLNGYLASLWRGIRDSIIRIVVYGSLSILTLAFSFIPPLALLVAVVGGFAIGFDLFEQPLSLLGFQMKRRISIITAHKLETLALGLLFSVMMIIPFGAVLFLPLAYHVAVSRISAWPDAKL